MSEKKCACNGKPYRSDGSYCPGCGRPVSEHATHGAARLGEGGQQ